MPYFQFRCQSRLACDQQSDNPSVLAENCITDPGTGLTSCFWGVFCGTTPSIAIIIHLTAIYSIPSNWIQQCWTNIPTCPIVNAMIVIHYSSPRPLQNKKRCCLRILLFYQSNPFYCAQLLVPILNKTIAGQIKLFFSLLPQQQLFSFPFITFAFAFD